MWMLFLVFLVFSNPSIPSAQEVGVITLIPTEVLSTHKDLIISADDQGKPDNSVLLRFKTGSFPPGAKITAANLSLIIKEPSGAAQTITANMLPYEAGLEKGLTGDEVLFGDNNLKRKELPKDGRTKWNANDVFLKEINLNKTHLNFENGFSLLLTTEMGKSKGWHSDRSKASKFRPRLIIEYIDNNKPERFQSDGIPAVKSPIPFVPGENPSVQNSYISREVTKKWSYTPAFYKGMVYTLNERNSQKYLDARSPLGILIWSAEMPEGPGQHIAVSNSGRLYIVGNQRIIVFQLDPDDPAQEPTVLHNFIVKDLNPSREIPPVIGPDGSLYLVNLQEVRGLNPDLQELWRVLLESKDTSRVTVGPSGEFVYLTARDEGLIAINAQTGEHFTKELPKDPKQDKLKRIDNQALHAPLVIRHPDGTEKIYVAANSLNSGVLACFNNFKTKFKKSGSEAITNAEGWEAKFGLYSQTAIDSLETGSKEHPSKTKKLYSVHVENGRGKLISIDWLSGNASSESESFHVGIDSPYILNGGNLVLDKDGNIFLWNGNGGQ
jgi:hypothetical protein